MHANGLSPVWVRMCCEMALLSCPVLTHGACEWFVSCVGAHVPCEMALYSCPVVAFRACVYCPFRLGLLLARERGAHCGPAHEGEGSSRPLIHLKFPLTALEDPRPWRPVSSLRGSCHRPGDALPPGPRQPCRRLACPRMKERVLTAAQLLG